jgi:hypothetical protein
MGNGWLQKLGLNGCSLHVFYLLYEIYLVTTIDGDDVLPRHRVHGGDLDDWKG